MGMVGLLVFVAILLYVLIELKDYYKDNQ